MIYEIVWESDRKRFKQKLQELLTEGWELQGGISCYYRFDTTAFAQAIILDEKKHQFEDINQKLIIAKKIIERLD